MRHKPLSLSFLQRPEVDTCSEDALIALQPQPRAGQTKARSNELPVALSITVIKTRNGDSLAAPHPLQLPGFSPTCSSNGRSRCGGFNSPPSRCLARVRCCQAGKMKAALSRQGSSSACSHCSGSYRAKKPRSPPATNRGCGSASRRAAIARWGQSPAEAGEGAQHPHSPARRDAPGKRRGMAVPFR